MLDTIKKFLKNRREQSVQEIKEIAAIPAGPFKEKTKIEFFRHFGFEKLQRKLNSFEI